MKNEILKNIDQTIKILFIGDIFGKPGMDEIKRALPIIQNNHQIDLVIAQAENVSGRKGLEKKDYQTLKEYGVNVFTLGNHVWAKKDVHSIINNCDVIRPYNISNGAVGKGTRIIEAKGFKIRVTSLLGISFNKLLPPWDQDYADNFFDAIDNVISEGAVDFHIVDFHAETTSEKNVLALYLDGKVDALLGTHTHVQTNDHQKLERNTLYITDAGMTGPSRSAIGANFKEVYERMRYEIGARFKVSNTPTQFNGVILELHTIEKRKNKIELINTLNKKLE